MTETPQALPPAALALLDFALANIDAHPETWDQEQWHCGTAACLAGHIHAVATADGDVTRAPIRSADPAVEALGARGLVNLYHPIWGGLNSRDALDVWRSILAGERVVKPGADLHDADLRGADLRGADLHDADLHDADLTGANLTGARGLPQSS